MNFWNSWCIPCRQEEPALQTFYAAHRNEPDFAMVGIVRDDSAEPIRSYVAAERDHLARRARSERQRGARLRHHRPTRDLRDLDRRALPRAVGSGR